MLVVHHLGKSQSERIVWLCEELEIPYELKRYARSPMRAPPEYKMLNPIGQAPIITDGDLTLAESAAIVQYIIAKYGNGRLAPAYGHPDFVPFTYWFNFANGTFQPRMVHNMFLATLKPPEDHPVMAIAKNGLVTAFQAIEARTGEAKYFAGEEFTAADIMMGFSLTTMRYFTPYDLTPYPNLRAYLTRIGSRPAYQRAMKKGDPDMQPLLS